MQLQDVPVKFILRGGTTLMRLCIDSLSPKMSGRSLSRRSVTPAAPQTRTWQRSRTDSRLAKPVLCADMMWLRGYSHRHKIHLYYRTIFGVVALYRTRPITGVDAYMGRKKSKHARPIVTVHGDRPSVLVICIPQVVAHSTFRCKPRARSRALTQTVRVRGSSPALVTVTGFVCTR